MSREHTRGAIIAIEGIIGAGKSTLARHIRANSSALVIDEAESPLLIRYARHPKRWALATQLDLLAQRVTALRSAHRLAESGRVIVLDRSILGDHAFARANWRVGRLAAEEYRVYSDLYDELMIHADPPDVVLSLIVDPETAHKRAQRRGHNIPEIEYQRALATAHREVMSDAVSRGVGVEPVPWGQELEGARYAAEVDFMLTRTLRKFRASATGEEGQ